MRELPILFSDAMVVAILSGSKSQTRRAVRPREGWCSPESWEPKRPGVWTQRAVEDASEEREASYGVEPGDRLWVREPARVVDAHRRSDGQRRIEVEYVADGTRALVPYPDRLANPRIGWRLANGTYREASRLTLDVTGVRVERAQDISDADVAAEGVDAAAVEALWADATATRKRDAWPAARDAMADHGPPSDLPPRELWRVAWTLLYGVESWDANPWVWVIDFRRTP